MRITRRIARGGMWNAVSEFGNQAINTILTIVLARMLLPADFGLIGKVVVITGFVGYFVELGFTPALMIRPNATSTDADSVFWTSIALSGTLFVMVFLTAPLVSRLYGDDRLVLLTRIIFLEFLFRPLTFVPNALESKALRYDRLAKSKLIGTATAATAAVVSAIAGLWVRSLVVPVVGCAAL